MINDPKSENYERVSNDPVGTNLMYSIFDLMPLMVGAASTILCFAIGLITKQPQIGEPSVTFSFLCLMTGGVAFFGCKDWKNASLKDGYLLSKSFNSAKRRRIPSILAASALAGAVYTLYIDYNNSGPKPQDAVTEEVNAFVNEGYWAVNLIRWFIS